MLLNVRERIHLKVLSLNYKLKNNLMPQYLGENVIPICPQHVHKHELKELGELKVA